MIKCVYFDNQRPDSFEEKSWFSPQSPYSIQVKQFSEEDIVPLHHADSLEMILCDGLKGTVFVDTRQFILEGKQLFVIPPHTVHATSVFACSGRQYVLKISPEALGTYFNLDLFLEQCGCTLQQLAYLCPEYDPVNAIVQQLIENDGNLPGNLIAILQLFQLLSRHTDPHRDSSGGLIRFKDSSLQELVNWTQRNYMKKITIDQAANLTGYSKYHFCSRFKAVTGMTYLSYLNEVRISHACQLLRNGQSVQQVCQKVGFDNLSYFIQLFRKKRHITPFQYERQSEAYPEQETP